MYHSIHMKQHTLALYQGIHANSQLTVILSKVQNSPLRETISPIPLGLMLTSQFCVNQLARRKKKIQLLKANDVQI